MMGDHVGERGGVMRVLVNRRPSPALIVSVVALVVAMSGAGYAAFKVPKDSVGTKQLKNSSVTAKKLADGAVTQTKLGSALTVADATHANSSDTAANAAELGSRSPSAFALAAPLVPIAP